MYICVCFFLVESMYVCLEASEMAANPLNQGLGGRRSLFRQMNLDWTHIIKGFSFGTPPLFYFHPSPIKKIKISQKYLHPFLFHNNFWLF